MKALLTALLLCTCSVAAAQALPVPGADNPRIQTFSWEGEPVRLMALPMTGLTVVLEPGESILQIELDRRGMFEVNVSAEGDSFLLMPMVEDAQANLSVVTDRRNYTFVAETGTSLMAAYVVRLVPEARYEDRRSPELPPGLQPFSDMVWTYRVRGDRSVRPLDITDNGDKTHIRFAAEQALPAVFAIGPSGKEQVVNGHMRGDVFVIDWVWQELVFRIDKEKATAKRSDEPESADG